jgi:uncharacterized membrane protein
MDDGLGGKFWLGLMGIIVAVGVGGFIFFLVIGQAWYLWGAFGALAVGFLLVMLIAWIYDRRQQRDYEDLPA